MNLDPKKKLAANYKILNEKSGRFEKPASIKRRVPQRRPPNQVDELLAAGMRYLIRRIIKEAL